MSARLLSPRFVLVAATVWVTMVIAAPLLDLPPIYSLAAAVCHQIPERSFHFSSGQIAVCARCLGLYMGGLGGLAAAVALAERIELRARAARRFVGAAALPTVLTLIAEWGLRWPVGNGVRFAAALPLGAGVAFVIGVALAGAAPRFRPSEVD